MAKLHVVTYGCQMNAHDSDRMVELMAPLGFEATKNKDEADLIVLNTCSVREKADQKMLSELGRLREWRAEHPTRILAVGGCVAQGMGQGLFGQGSLLGSGFRYRSVGGIARHGAAHTTGQCSGRCCGLA